MILSLILVAVLAGLLLFIGFGLVRSLVELLRQAPPPVLLPREASERLVKELEIDSTDVVFDLGCADGQLLRLACSAQPAAHFVGIDHDPVLILKARWRLCRRRSQIKLQRKSFFKIDLLPATKVICYLSTGVMARLEPKFDQELQPGARLISADYKLPNRQPTKIVWVNKKARRGRVLYIYDY